MPYRKGFCGLLCCVGLVVLGGCQWGSSTEKDDLDDDLVEADDSDDSDADGEEGDSDEVADGQQDKLELKLQVGDRFPLTKTVEQTLVQLTPQGEFRGSSNLEMMLAVTVEEIPDSGDRQGQKRMGVRYHRVRYSQDLGGQKIHYDSQSPRFPLPEEVQGYHGLVGNGFYFWLGPDNQLVEMVGFTEFLERCLKQVPPERQPSVRAALAATSGSDGIANFVDDSIGLLPNRSVKLGDTWGTSRQVLQPVPMHISTQYTLHKLDDATADVAILGSVSPSATYGPSGQPNKDLSVSVRGGRSFGNCLIDRRTGLPIQSRVEQALDMLVNLPSGQNFEQRKHVVTTIRAFPEQGAPQSANSGGMPPAPAASSGVQQADYSQELQGARGAATTDAGFNSPGRE